MTIGERIKQVRGKMSQEEFGLKIGVSKFSVSSYENEKRGTTDRVIADICREFDVNEDWLRTGDGSMILQNENTELAYLAREYDLDTLDRKIIESYLRLSKFQRQSIKRFIMDIAEQEDTPAIHEKADTIPIFTAAMSEDKRGMEHTALSRADMEKLRNAQDPDEL